MTALIILMLLVPYIFEIMFLMYFIIL